jgi:hypothetical protein
MGLNRGVGPNVSSSARILDVREINAGPQFLSSAGHRVAFGVTVDVAVRLPRLAAIPNSV